MSKYHKIALRSITDWKKGGTIPLDGAFMWIDGDKGAIVNESWPYERYFIGKQEVTTKLISRGDQTHGCIFTGQEYTPAMYILFRDIICEVAKDFNAASCDTFTSSCDELASKC